MNNDKISDGHVDDQASRYEPQQDEFSKQNFTDSRKPKLTLRMINRLKKIRSSKELEMTKKQGLLGIMYGIDKGEEEI
jgi:hypothetical protein